MELPIETIKQRPEPVLNKIANARLTKEIILAHDLPFPFKLRFLDPNSGKETEELIGPVLYADLTFTREVCPKLPDEKYTTAVYFYFPDDYPFARPTIMTEGFDHPFIKDGIEINLSDYWVGMGFKGLLANVYLILQEALNNSPHGKHES